MKKIINISIGFLMLGIVGGMEMNSMTIKNGIITLILLILFLCLINRKSPLRLDHVTDKLTKSISNIITISLHHTKVVCQVFYKGICSERGKTVPDGMALGYALSRVLEDENQKQEFIEWFYSGNWVKVEEESETD